MALVAKAGRRSFENRLAQRAECMPYAAYADIRVSIRLRKSS